MPARANAPPTPAIRNDAPCGLRQAFDGAGSLDMDGVVSDLTWDLGDGTTTTGAFVQHDYAMAGPYRVKLTARDDSGLTATTQRDLLVAPCRPLQLALVEAQAKVGVPLRVCPTASGANGAYVYEAQLRLGDGQLAPLPAGARFDAKSGCLEWTPGADESGTHCVQVTVTSATESVSQCLTVAVAPAPPPPAAPPAPTKPPPSAPEIPPTQAPTAPAPEPVTARARPREDAREAASATAAWALAALAAASIVLGRRRGAA